MQQKTIKWGVIGLGNISRQFVTDLLLVADATLQAVGSRDSTKSINFGSEFNAENSYGSYLEVMQDLAVDIIYIGTPHDSHAALSIQAMNHGKAVLCEKPIAVNCQELNAMITTAKANNVFFMEAFWSRFNPTIVKVKELIAAGEIGEVKYINADFSVRIDAPDTSRMYNMDLIGGSLLDMGVYPVFLAYLLLGKPEQIAAQAKFYKTGVDFQTSMLLSYPGALAVLYSGFASNTDMVAKISGTDARIEIHRWWHQTQGYSLIRGDKREDFTIPTTGKGFTHEIEECHQCLRSAVQQSTKWSWNNSLELLQIVDTVRKEIGLQYPKEIPV